jgi:hypothetical protein
MGGGEVICGSSGWKSLKAGVSGKGDERVEEGEGESSLEPMVTISGLSEEGIKLDPPRVMEMS